MTAKVQTHDYSARCWGRDYTFHPRAGSDGCEAEMLGWGCGLSAGDFIIIQGEKPGHTTRYKIDEIEYFGNPKDMWKAKVHFAPRPHPVPENMQ